ncbi:hypothetical protein GOX2526 (plasmid) [Gluconobacter oxydans 621H]|uniref:Uncharacterized protein n=1 Tax=Gluconobacter oxydans (strain 621H) TaxID=290633 RepID=Q5HY11_GLUOX|nr:hypothetical protein GOX2526 [Gluconobacter oxydans 621H]
MPSQGTRLHGATEGRGGSWGGRSSCPERGLWHSRPFLAEAPAPSCTAPPHEGTGHHACLVCAPRPLGKVSRSLELARNGVDLSLQGLNILQADPVSSNFEASVQGDPLSAVLNRQVIDPNTFACVQKRNKTHGVVSSTGLPEAGRMRSA